MEETNFIQEFSILIKLDQIKSKKFNKKIAASKEQCLKLAKRFDLIELKRFRANLDLVRRGSSVLVDGIFDAEVVQQCVITLEPVLSKIEGNFSCNYSESAAKNDCNVVDFDLTTDDPPEPIVNGEIDVGIVLAEHFGLELDPFPRSPGVNFDLMEHETGAKSGNESANPFAILKKLK